MSAESHSLAISIEWTLCELFKCERFGLGGYINSDKIEKIPIQSFRIWFATIYAGTSKETRKLIDSFIDINYQYEDMNIEEIGIAKISKLHDKFKSIIKR